MKRGDQDIFDASATMSGDEASTNVWAGFSLSNRQPSPALQRAYAGVMALIALLPLWVVAKYGLVFYPGGVRRRPYVLVPLREVVDGNEYGSISDLLSDDSTMELSDDILPFEKPDGAGARRKTDALFPPASEAAGDLSAYTFSAAVFYVHIFTGASLEDVLKKKVNVVLGTSLNRAADILSDILRAFHPHRHR